ncbi:MAG: hypothetical protein ACE5GS_01680 [Kiloniellaceae bacterium]
MIPRTIRRPALALVPLILAVASPAAGQDQVSAAITKSDCRRLVKHVPAPDVAYRPGVDVRGRAVAPADLDDGVRIAPPETIEIDIQVELEDRFGIPADPDLFDADAQIGNVTVRDGRAYFNGQPLQNEAQADLTERCQEILYGRR